MAFVEAKCQEDNEWRTVLLAELRRIAQALEGGRWAMDEVKPGSSAATGGRSSAT